MSMIRAFIALEIPPALQNIIAEHSAALQRDIPHAIRWVAAANIHLTLKFLGDTSPASLQGLIHSLSAVINQQEPFQISIGGFGIFPNPKRPRVLWIGIQAPPDLDRLYHAIETACARLGYPAEEKPFNPHLTLGRVREEADQTRLRPALQNYQIGQLGAIDVESVTLFRSDLRPQGPSYTALAHIPLAQLDS